MIEKKTNGSNKSKIELTLRALLLFILVLALGFVAVNQSLGFFYKTYFLASPCALCGNLNPEVESCLSNLSYTETRYWTPDGWRNITYTNNQYEIIIPEK